jgi:hypothetical protein
MRAVAAAARWHDGEKSAFWLKRIVTHKNFHFNEKQVNVRTSFAYAAAQTGRGQKHPVWMKVFSLRYRSMAIHEKSETLPKFDELLTARFSSLSRALFHTYTTRGSFACTAHEKKVPT